MSDLLIKSNLKEQLINNIEEVVLNMDLLLEGVNAPIKSLYLELGLMILESFVPDFKYSSNTLNYNQKMNELKKYYYQIGYSNEQILSLINNYNKARII